MVGAYAASKPRQTGRPGSSCLGLTLPCEHMLSHAASTGGTREDMWAATGPPDEGVAGSLGEGGGASRASPGLLTRGVWEDPRSLDFPKASDTCPCPKPAKKTKQPTQTRDLGK